MENELNDYQIDRQQCSEETDMQQRHGIKSEMMFWKGALAMQFIVPVTSSGLQKIDGRQVRKYRHVI